MKGFSKWLTGLLVLALVVSMNLNLQQYRKGLSKDGQMGELLIDKQEYLEMNDHLRLDKATYDQVSEDYISLTDAYDRLKITFEDYKAYHELGQCFTSYAGRSISYRNPGYDTSEIVASLRSKPDLIGISGVLGGTMMFENIQLISNRLAWAQFSDGHILGEGIYQYWIGTDGQWHWERVLEYLDDNLNFETYVDDGRLPNEMDIHMDQVNQHKNLEELLSLYRDQLDGAYSEGYGSWLYSYYRNMPIESFISTLEGSENSEKEGLLKLLCYEVIGGERDGIGPDYLTNTLESMVSKTPEQTEFINRLLGVLEDVTSARVVKLPFDHVDQLLEGPIAEKDEVENLAYPLMASIPEKFLWLYGADQGSILKYGGIVQEFDWYPSPTPSYVLPQVSLRDMDQDGVEEIVCVLYVGSGTGVSVEELRVLKQGSNGFYTDYGHDDYIEILSSKMETSIDSNTNIVEIRLDGINYECPLSEEQLAYEVVGYRLNSQVVAYDIGDDIRLRVALAAVTEELVTPLYTDYAVTAQVVFENTAFGLEDVRLDMVER